MELLLIMLGGGGVFWYVRAVNRRGREAVRAYLYVAYVTEGASALEANRRVHNVSRVPTTVTQAMLAIVDTLYDGKSLALIAHAYRMGLFPQAPAWQQKLASEQYGTEPTVRHTPSANKQSVGPADETPQATSVESPQSTNMVASDFDAYYRSFVALIKRREGKLETDFHPVEIMDDEPLKRAYRDGVSVERLVEMCLAHWAKPQNH